MTAVRWAYGPGIPDDRGTVATVGTFDGMHLGHWAVLEEIRDNEPLPDFVDRTVDTCRRRLRV